MARIQWARAAQFNWVFDNMGGAPLQEAVAGGIDGATAQVGTDGRVIIEDPNPGGGKVFYIRGVWLQETSFPWSGFWAEPMSGDLTNYYQGGSFTNETDLTAVTLGTALSPGTWVQLYYIYRTGEVASQYEALNNYPCIRRAYRSRDDYTYDFAVDRILDLMVFLHGAGQAQGRDYSQMIYFLWDAFQSREESRTSPLMHDTFERRLWDRGPHLIYRGATNGAEAFQDFQNDLLSANSGRALHVKVDLPTTQDAAWFGYGLDWSLEQSPFKEIDRVNFTVKGNAATRKIHNLTKVGSGSATLVIPEDYTLKERRRFLVQIETTGAVGEATFRWSKDGGITWEASGLVSGDEEHALSLWGGLQIYWESGDGTDLVAGDYWAFWCGTPETHPRRLLVTLNDSQAADSDPWGPEHTFVHALPDRFSELTDFELAFSQFWRRDNVIDDGDRVRSMWGAWHSTTQSDSSDITIGDREETEVLSGDTFYTQRQVTWNLSSYATAFGVWVGIDPNRCNSTGHLTFNFLIKPVVPGVSSLTLRVKVKDAQGSYFYQDQAVQVDAWQRVTAIWGEMSLESGSLPLSHPLQAVDIGIPDSPPSNGTFYLTDLKFDDHVAFWGLKRLRLLEFKIEQQGLSEHEWWLDEVSLNLEGDDSYPYAPRLAISLTPYGQNPWRGPTLVHYAQPLAPYLAGVPSLTENYLNLHRDAQDEFFRRYHGVKGPIMPVHTRNDVENIELCGEEDFNRFSWWRRHRDFGKVTGFWHFNEALTDASINGYTLTWQGGGDPAYATGLCQPGRTALDLDGSHYLSLGYPQNLDVKTEDFTIEVVLQPRDFSGGSTIVSKISWGEAGYEVLAGESGQVLVRLADGAGMSDFYPNPPLSLTTQNYHYLAVSLDRDGQFTFCLDGQLGYCTAACSGSLANSQSFTVGRYAKEAWHFFKGTLDLIRLHQGRALGGAELRDNWQILQGQLNGSAYPEVGHALGQFWAFQRLAEYFYVTQDEDAWEILENWLTWINTYGAADASGWRFPTNFSEFGFTYGPYDPGAAAALALGCLSIYARNGHDLAALWARRILDDLRVNRWDPDFGGYKSDYHYAWLNALVLLAFGYAVNGRSGQAYTFAATDDDKDHFDAFLSWLFSHSGNEKPNLLNADLIPFTYSEAVDVWEYAPHYLAMRQTGSLEGVVLMLGVALEYGKAKGDWLWFQRLLRFLILDNLVVLSPAQIRSLTMTYDQAGIKNLVRVKYADYDQDNSKFAEAREQAAITLWGEQAVELDFRYGEPVVMENSEMASILASRLLKRLAPPWERVEVETWLEGARIELGDTVAVTSDFHDLKEAEFSVFGKEIDLSGRSVSLNLTRTFNCTWYWAVDASGSDYDSCAIERNSPFDPNYAYRSYAG